MSVVPVVPSTNTASGLISFREAARAKQLSQVVLWLLQNTVDIIISFKSSMIGSKFEKD